MDTPMNVKVTCSKCDQVISEDKDVEAEVYLIEVDLIDHRCPTSLHDLRGQYGASDVESLAIALYYEFHGRCPCPCHSDNKVLPWEMFDGDLGGINDSVVEKFRMAAKVVADLFSDGEIGGIYYGEHGRQVVDELDAFDGEGEGDDGYD
jgi:hypothetical protein